MHYLMNDLYQARDEIRGFFADEKVVEVFGHEAIKKYEGDLIEAWPKMALESEQDVRKAVTRCKHLHYDFCILYEVKSSSAHQKASRVKESLSDDYKENC